MKRLECLDGLRGVLAVYVMLGHMAPFAALPSWIAGSLSHGGAAVDVFFMLSGLVILRSLESCRFKAGSFLILRATRIFPVFLPMLALGVTVQLLPIAFDAMPWIGPGSVAADIWPVGWPTHWVVEIAAHLTMTHGLFPTGALPDVWNSFLAAAWSLSTEWQFYVLALVLGRSRIGRERLVEAFLVLAVVGLAWDTAAPDAWRFSRAFLPNKAEYFALGIASAAWVDRRSVRSFAVVLGATLLLCAAGGNLGKLLPPLIWTLCLAAQLYPGRIALIAAPLRWRSVQWFGAVSYPIYLANEPIQKAVCYVLIRFAAGDGVKFTSLWIPAAVLVPIGAAALLHRYVETPAVLWGRGLARKVVVTGVEVDSPRPSWPGSSGLPVQAPSQFRWPGRAGP
jgi:peptidoglycan/LPS O-acetylase OafA/YrhL